MRKTKEQRKRRAKGSKQIALAASAKSPADILQKVGGSPIPEWNQVLLNQALGTVTLNVSQMDQITLHQTAVAGFMMQFQPLDQIEGMLATHLVGLHNAMMENLRRAAIPDQHLDACREYWNQADKLSRAFGLSLDTLKRHRGGNEQKISVEHLHVHAPGQIPSGPASIAVRGGTPRIEEQPHAKQIIDASVSPVRRENAKGDKVPVARDGERPVPDARRPINRRPKRK